MTLEICLWTLGAFTSGLILYQVLRRFSPIRKAVVSYHVLLVLATFKLFVVYYNAEVSDGGQLLAKPNQEAILIGLLAFFATFVVLRIVDSIFIGHLLDKGFGIHISSLARHIVMALLLAVAVIVILILNDVQVTGLVATSAVGSAIIGLALQDLLGNVVSGVALQTERPFQVGDWISVDDAEGRVVEMNWRATRLITIDGHHLTIPNSHVSKANIRNFNSPTDIQARHVKVGIEYGVAPEKVKSAIMEAAVGAHGVVNQPKPEIWLIKFGDFCITYEVKFWIDKFGERYEIEDNVMSRIWYLLKRNNISVPFPIRNVYHHHGDQQILVSDTLTPGSPAVTEMLRGIELLKPLSDEALLSVSNRLSIALFNAGENLVIQNKPGDSFMIIGSGEVSVTVDGCEVAKLGERSHFGEMSLLTGEPRSATVTAVTDTRVLIIDRDCFETVLKANPEVTEKLSKVLEHILDENLTKMKARGIAVANAKPHTAQSILTLVRGFFHLG